MTTKSVTLHLPIRAYRRLESLKSETEAKTYTEVVARALRLYEACVESELGGATVKIIWPNGKTEDALESLRRN